MLSLNQPCPKSKQQNSKTTTKQDAPFGFITRTIFFIHLFYVSNWTLQPASRLANKYNMKNKIFFCLKDIKTKETILSRLIDKKLYCLTIKMSNSLFIRVLFGYKWVLLNLSLFWGNISSWLVQLSVELWLKIKLIQKRNRNSHIFSLGIEPAELNSYIQCNSLLLDTRMSLFELIQFISCPIKAKLQLSIPPRRHFLSNQKNP